MSTPRAVDRGRMRDVVTLALELWAVRIVVLVADDGTDCRAGLALSDEPEYEGIILGAMKLPSRWAALDEVNRDLLCFTEMEAARVAGGQDPLLSASVLRALGTIDGSGDVRPEDLGVPCERIPLDDARRALRVVLDLSPPDIRGHRTLTRELAFAASGAARDREDANRRHAARLLWLRLGGRSLTGPEEVPRASEFVARLGEMRIPTERRFIVAPQVRHQLVGAEH